MWLIGLVPATSARLDHEPSDADPDPDPDPDADDADDADEAAASDPTGERVRRHDEAEEEAGGFDDDEREGVLAAVLVSDPRLSPMSRGEL